VAAFVHEAGAVRVLRVLLTCLAWLPALPAAAHPQDPTPGTAPGDAVPVRLTCSSTGPERRHCEANTSQGVVLARSLGTTDCLLGRNWGYDDTGVWVSDGCSGEFVVAAPTLAAPDRPAAAAAPRRRPTDRIESWGEFEPGDGFLVGRNDAGELAISAYALVRYVNQMPTGQTFTDHLGNVRPVDTRNDFFPHRVLIFFKGWLGSPKLIYNVFLWTVNTTDQDAIFGVIGYQFGRRFSWYGGINGTPGTRSLQGSHPFWLGHDRVMADEFFRPYFAFGTWAQGEITPGLWYNAFVGNNSSSLGITATQLDRELSTGVSTWWMPTTKEFGPRGAFGDWEWHEKLATRVGISSAFSPEERFTNSTTGATGNTTIKLADSVNVFDTGALAPGVTVDKVDYRLVAVDAGVKYKGVFVQTEWYFRNLHGLVADRPLPVREIKDRGFYVQGAFYPIRRRLEVYSATSQIFGDRDAGFDDSSEYLVGFNYYPFDTRNHRFNVQVMNVNRSPVSSTFGYYVGGQDGTTVSAAMSVLF
jgi:hypothetical protein